MPSFSFYGMLLINRKYLNFAKIQLLFLKKTEVDPGYTCVGNPSLAGLGIKKCSLPLTTSNEEENRRKKEPSACKIYGHSVSHHGSSVRWPLQDPTANREELQGVPKFFFFGAGSKNIFLGSTPTDGCSEHPWAVDHCVDLASGQRRVSEGEWAV